MKAAPSSEGGGQNDSSVKINELQQQISRLREDNNILKSQYEEAMNLTKQMDEIHQENTNLTRQIHKLTAEKDEINRRLHISLQMNEDYKIKCEQPQNNNMAENNELRESIEKANKAHQAQIQDMNQVIQDTTQMLNAVRKENSDIKATINSVVDAAKSYFGENFSSHESLRQFLLQPKPVVNNVSQLDSFDSPVKMNSRLENVSLHSLKAKVKNERKLRKEIYAKLVNSEKAFDKQKSSLLKKISELEERIADLQKAAKNNELKQKQEFAENTSQLSIYEENVEKMRIKIQQLKEQNERLEEIQKRPNPLAGELNELQLLLKDRENKLKESDSNVSSLKKQIASLVSQLKTSEMRINSLKKKICDVQSLHDECSGELVEVKTEKERLQIINEELKEKYKSVNAQLKADRSSSLQNKSALDQLETNYSKLKSSNTFLQTIMDKQKDEINSLYNERERLINTIQKLNYSLKEFDNYYTRMKQQQDILQEQKLKAKLEKEKMEPKIIETIVEPEIPITSWFSTEFPRELTNMISEVAKNEALPINAKLRHVLSIIGKFYNAQTFEGEIQNKDKDRQINALNDRYTTLLNSISSQMEKDKDLTNLPDPNKTVIEWIIRMKDEKSYADAQKNAISNEVNVLLEKFNISSLQELDNQFSKAQNDLHTCQNVLRKEIKKNKREKKSRKELSESFADHQKEIESVFNKQKNKIEDLEKACDNYIIEIRQLKNKNNELVNENVRIKNETEDQVGEVTIERDAFLTQMRNEYEKEKIELVAMLEDKSAKIENYCRQIVKLEKEVTQWRKTAESLKKQKKAKEKENAEYEKQINETELDWKDRITKEKANITAQFQQLVSELKTKNKELRTVLTKTSQALDESEENVKLLSSKLANLESLNQENELTIQSQRDEMEREKQLIETKIKAANLSSEMKYQSLIEEEKSKRESEKRKLFGFVAKSFRQFFDGNTQLTDDCFKSIIKTASEEIDRLLAEEAAIKRLLGIGPNESPQDSVAKLLLSLYRPQ